MINNELYIDGQLCDLPADFTVRLNRQLLSPGELNTKDAQFSYSVSLPATERNNRIFQFASVEEVGDKFTREYPARYICRGVPVFDGLLRLSQITRTAYKGNLLRPAPKTARDVFGEKKFSDIPRYDLPFGDFVDSASAYNRAAADSPQPAIFPFALYSLLGKVPDDAGGYSANTVWDETVRYGLSSFPPSVNPLLMLRHVFQSQGYSLEGTAFLDTRLNQLYQSYKNDPAYRMPWNYGIQGRVHLTGHWSNIRNERTASPALSYETKAFVSPTERGDRYACDLFDSVNAHVSVVEDPGGNVIQQGGERSAFQRTQLVVPVTGFYRVRFRASVRLLPASFHEDTERDLSFVGRGVVTNFASTVSAIKLLRDRGEGTFDLASSRLDGSFFRDNLPQGIDSETLYAPALPLTGPQVVFVDAAQNARYVAGFQWGVAAEEDKNPQDAGNRWAAVNVAKPAPSWDASRAGEAPTRVAVHNDGYYRRDPGSDVWRSTGRFKCELKNLPSANLARRGTFDGGAAEDPLFAAEGRVNCIVWLEAGERLTVADVSSKGVDPSLVTRTGWVARETFFDLILEPFQQREDWLQMDESGRGLAVMDWAEPTDFDTDRIDLMGFLPVDMRVDDYVDNFCKAFNLQLTQVNARRFELNVRQSRRTLYGPAVDLDGIASVADRSNSPLGLPSLYRLGFTINTDEEGYFASGDDGGGEFATRAAGGAVVEQKSSFSYNWFKTITQGSATFPLPVITKHEVWIGLPTPEKMARSFTDLPLRFWYFDGLLNDTGAIFPFPVEVGRPLSVARVSNTLTGWNTLSYHNRPRTILDNYFTLLIDGSSHYTEVEAFLSPEQYETLAGTVYARFNDDLYYVAEISGYDPSGRNKTKLKLIRKIA